MDPMTFAVSVSVPGIVIVAAGTVLLARASMRRLAPSVRGLRLFYLGLALLLLVPGIAIIAAVLVGRLMWPAALGALVPILMGSGLLYGLRLWWDDPAHGILGESRRLD